MDPVGKSRRRRRRPYQKNGNFTVVHVYYVLYCIHYSKTFFIFPLLEPEAVFSFYLRKNPKFCYTSIFDKDTTTMAPTIPESVAVHPLVLLSVVDHYNRVCKDNNKYVIH